MDEAEGASIFGFSSPSSETGAGSAAGVGEGPGVTVGAGAPPLTADSSAVSVFLPANPSAESFTARWKD